MGKIFDFESSKTMKEEVLQQKFLNIYETHSDSIFRYCLFRISSRETAVDITQDVFMRFWDYLRQGKEIKNDKAFIFMIARNSVIDFYRKKKSVSLDAILEENEDGFFMADSGGSKVDIEMSTESRFVLDKISELPPDDQQIVYLRFVEDLKPKDIAEILGISANAVSVRVIRAIEKLQKS